MLNKDKRGVFGLNAVQAFFAIILGIALLAYVIVVVMGTLNNTTILPSSSGNLVVNETGLRLNTSNPSTLALASTADGFANPVITTIWADWNQTLHGGSLSNLSTGYNVTILLGNATVDSVTGVLSNASTALGNVSISYTYTRNTVAQSNANAILGNTSQGISGFFGNISPVFAILAVLVIILILVVLVRVVQAPSQGSAPQL